MKYRRGLLHTQKLIDMSRIVRRECLLYHAPGESTQF
jgi:hypothetical protein